ncbi:MAG: DUF1127 domain-containing protein [Sneathiella sp.]
MPIVMHVLARNEVANTRVTFSRRVEIWQLMIKAMADVSRLIRKLLNYFSEKFVIQGYTGHLDDHILRDIGITRSEIDRLVYGPRDHSGRKIPTRLHD